MKSMIIVAAMLAATSVFAQETGATESAPAATEQHEAAPAAKMNKKEAHKACIMEAKAAHKKLKGKELKECISEKMK